MQLNTSHIISLTAILGQMACQVQKNSINEEFKGEHSSPFTLVKYQKNNSFSDFNFQDSANIKIIDDTFFIFNPKFKILCYKNKAKINNGSWQKIKNLNHYYLHWIENTYLLKQNLAEIIPSKKDTLLIQKSTESTNIYTFDSLQRIKKIEINHHDSFYFVFYQKTYNFIYNQPMLDTNNVIKKSPAKSLTLKKKKAVSLPFPYINQDSLKYFQIKNGQASLDGKKVVLYSTFSCPPCAHLVKDINNSINNYKINAQQIIYINNGQNNELAVDEYIKQKNIKFPIYFNIITQKTFSWPTIGFYENGRLIKTEIGYDKNTILSIENYFY